MPALSVIMPVFNGEKYLKEAINSILSQSFTDYEFLIINDGSADRSEDIIKSYSDSRIKFLNNSRNMGLIYSLNRGIEEAKGKYIVRMDADDISLPERFKKQFDFLEKNKNYVLCGTNAIVINEKGNLSGKILNFSDNDLLQINLLFSVPFVHPSVMIRKSVFSENFKYDPYYKNAEDYDLWLRIAQNNKIYNLPDNLLMYRWHSANVSVINTGDQQNKKDELILRQLKEAGIDPSPGELYYHKLAFSLYSKGKKIGVQIEDFKGVESWFDKLVKQNEKIRKYNRDLFIAFLWSRWVVLCISQKKITKIFNPGFVSYKPCVIRDLIRIIFFLKKK